MTTGMTGLEWQPELTGLEWQPELTGTESGEICNKF
jgi:hypothetical protein